MRKYMFVFFAAILSTLGVGAPVAYADTYTVVGHYELCGSNWTWADANNDMILEDGLYVWRRINLELSTEEIVFSIGRNHNDKDVPGSGKIILANHEGPGTYAVTITFNAETKEIATTLLKQKETKYILMGVNGDYETGIPFIYDEVWHEYVLNLQTIIKATDTVYLVMTINGEPFIRCAKVYLAEEYGSDAVYSIVGEEGSERIVIEDGVYDITFMDDDMTKLGGESIKIRQSGYARNVTNRYGTMCVPYTVPLENIYGATFYKIVGRDADKIYLESVDTLDYDVPYIFEATDSQVKVIYWGGKSSSGAAREGGMVGTYANDTEVPVGCYILKGDAVRRCDSGCYINANRAYIVMEDIPETKPTPMPDRKYIGLDVQGETLETSIEKLFTPEIPIKTIENGQLIIIRDGVKYNIQGVRL